MEKLRDPREGLTNLTFAIKNRICDYWIIRGLLSTGGAIIALGLVIIAGLIFFL